MTRRLAAGAAAVLLVGGLAGGLVAGCGGDDAEISRRAADQLHDQVAAIQYAAAGEAYGPARQGLEQLRATTERLVERGQVEPVRAEQIFDRIDRVDEVLAGLEQG